MADRSCTVLLLVASLSPVLASLDSSSGALAAATTTVSIGTSPKYWSTIPSDPSSYSVGAGSKLSFTYKKKHDVYLMPSETAWEECKFSGATLLAGGPDSTDGVGAESGNKNLYEGVVVNAVPNELFIACSNHCTDGQKIKITVTAAASTTESSPPPPPTPPPMSPDFAAWVAACPDKEPSMCVNRKKMKKYCPDNAAADCKGSFGKTKGDTKEEKKRYKKKKKKKCKKFQKKCKGTCDICPMPLPPTSPSPPPSPPKPPPPAAQGGSFQDTPGVVETGRRM